MERQSKMIGKDSKGVLVSLLNDDQPSKKAASHQRDSMDTGRRHSALLSSVVNSPISTSLTRQDSWSTSCGSKSPTTPLSTYEDQHAFYRSQQNSPNLPHHPQHAYKQGASQSGYQFPAYPPSTNSSPIEQQPYPQEPYAKSRQSSIQGQREASEAGEGKRYPCRLASEYNCDKTFTTSGHASRHSKIHTAEKAVKCTHSGCDKKFTRSDNMKQHLETHRRDKRKSSENGVNKRSHVKSSSRSSRDSSIAALPKDLSPLSLVVTDSSNVASMDLLALAAESRRL